MRVVLPLLALVASVSAHIIPPAGSYWVSQNDMPIQRSDAPAVTVNGVIYMSGGCVSTNQPVSGGCDTLSNQTIAWDTTQANPTWQVLAPMPRYRYRDAVAAVGNLIYHIGGRTVDTHPNETLMNDLPINEIDVYNITSNTWFTLPTQTCNCLNSSDGAAFVIGTNLYYTGGYYGHYYDYTIQSTYVLDTTQPLASQQFKTGMVPDRWWKGGDLGAVTVNGLGYVLGGWGAGNLNLGTEDYCNPLTFVSAYNATTNTWTNITSFKHGRGDFALAAVNDRYIFVAGGETKAAGCNANYSFSIPVADVERYDTWTGKWIDYAPIAINDFRFTGVAIKDIVYVFGGQGSDVVTVNANNQSIDTFPLRAEVFTLNTTYYDSLNLTYNYGSSTGMSSTGSIISTGTGSSSNTPTGTGSSSTTPTPTNPPSKSSSTGPNAATMVTFSLGAVVAMIMVALL